jgi:hypothetical protein
MSPLDELLPDESSFDDDALALAARNAKRPLRPGRASSAKSNHKLLQL